MPQLACLFLPSKKIASVHYDLMVPKSAIVEVKLTLRHIQETSFDICKPHLL